MRGIRVHQDSVIRRSSFLTEAGMGNLLLSDFIYYLGFFCYCLASEIGVTNFETIFGLDTVSVITLLKYFAVLCIACKLLMQKYTFLQMILAALFILIGIVTWMSSGGQIVLWSTLFIVAGKGVKLAPLAVISLFITVFIVLVTSAAAYYGIIDTYYLPRDGVLTARNSMGFSHPNHLGKLLFLTCACLITLRFWQLGPIEFVVGILTFCIVLFIVDSRTSAFSIVLLLSAVVIFRLIPQSAKKAFFLVCAAIFIASCIISIYLMIEYNPANRIHSLLNSISNERFYYAHKYYIASQITPFGMRFAGLVEVSGRYINQNFLVDNAYAHLLLAYGFIPFLCMILGVIMLFIRAIHEKQFGICIIILAVFGVMGITESFLIRIDANFFLIALSSILYAQPVCEFDSTVPDAENREVDFRRETKNAIVKKETCGA